MLGMRDSYRSVALKTALYRIYSMAILFSFSYLFVYDWKFSLFASLSVETLKLGQYYIFERLWRKFLS